MNRIGGYVFTVLKQLDNTNILKLKMSSCQIVAKKGWQYSPWLTNGVRREEARGALCCYRNFLSLLPLSTQGTGFAFFLVLMDL